MGGGSAIVCLCGCEAGWLVEGCCGLLVEGLSVEVESDWKDTFALREM